MPHVIRSLAGVLLFVSVMLANVTPTQARNSLKFDGFEANIHDILSGVANYCQRNPGKMAFAASGSDYRDELFRKACGKGLLRQLLPFGDWAVFYCEADHPDGHKSIFAAIKRLSYGGREYLIVIGDEMLVRFPGQEKQEVTHRPAALLNVREGDPAEWVEVIDYVRPDGNGWNVRHGSLSDFSVGQSHPDENVHAIWQRFVAADFGKLVRNMKDMNWPD